MPLATTPPPTLARTPPREGRAPSRRRFVALAWVWVLPFVVCALPYVVAYGRHGASPVPATFTVDEPLYLAESRAIATRTPLDVNPWTRVSGTDLDAYRFFGGSMAFAAGWDALGGDATLGLALAAGLTAALTSAAASSIFRRLLRGAAAPLAWILAPLVVIGPWDCLGEVARFRIDLTRLETFHSLARPFTSQWGPCLYVAALACAASFLDAPRGRTLAFFTLATAAQFFTFPYAVPSALLVWTIAAVLSSSPAPRSPSRAFSIAVPWAATALLSIATRWLHLPAAAEADHEALTSARIGGSALFLLAFGSLAWFGRRAFPSPMRAFVPAVALALLLAMVAGRVVPGRLHVVEHTAYLFGVTTALVLLPLVANGVASWRPRLARLGGLGAACATGILAMVSSVRTVEAHEGAFSQRSAWADAMAALPRLDDACLLCEGESIDGPGAWSAIASPLPVFYSFSSEYSTMASLDQRRWRRAWYLHFRGLTADEVARRGSAVVDEYPRFFGAHNTVPRSDIAASMENYLRRIESHAPDAMRFLASRGRILCLEDSRRPTFRRERLEASMHRVRTTALGAFSLDEYEPARP